jgi:transglutaminase-like putative cysteine protease
MKTKLKVILSAITLTALFANAAEPENVPELMRTLTGKKITTVSEWENHRADLLKLFENRVFGVRPIERPKLLTFSQTEPDKLMMGGKAIRKKIKITYAGDYGTNSFNVLAFIPAAQKKSPAFLYACNHQREKAVDPELVNIGESWPVKTIIDRGYAMVTYFVNEVAPDRNYGNFIGVFPCFSPDIQYRPTNAWGTLSAWAWGASRVLDWMETEPLIDSDRVAVIGHSRGGKTSILAGATDERFAMVCANDSGCAGAKLNHIDIPKSENFAKIVRTFPFWFCQDFIECVNRDKEIDFDQHQLLALIAPRLLCIGSASKDEWAGPCGEYWAARLASPAWELYGKKGLVSDGFPKPLTALQDGFISYHLNEGTHNLAKFDWETYLNFADKHLRSESAITNVTTQTEDFIKAYPDADSVMLEECERVKFNADGTYLSERESFRKLLTEKGRREAMSYSFSYSARYGRFRISHVGIIGADGIERKIDISSLVNESTDNSSMSANIYDPMDRKVSCTIPGLEIGDVLHIKTIHETFAPRVRGQWSDVSIMQWEYPILKSVYEVAAPSSLPIKAKAVLNPLGNVSTSVKTLEDGSTVHTFVATNSPQAFPEPDMPPFWTQVQNVRVSTLASWRELSKWYWELSLPHLQKTNDAIAQKVKELCKDAKDDDEKMRRIFKFVSQEIRYMGLTMEDESPGYAPHDVDITFNNRYGVCRDKAGLLVAMLRLVNLKAYPVLINVGAKMDKNIPQPFFNHAIVAVEKGGKDYILMDPTNENTKDLFPAYLSNKSYLVCRPEGEELMLSPVPDPKNNAVKVKSCGKLEKNGDAVVESDIVFTGVNDTIYRGVLARRTEEETREFFKNVAKNAADGAEVLKCEITPKSIRDTSIPLRVKMLVRYPETVISGETIDEITLPMISKTLGAANWMLSGSTSLEKRAYTLSLNTTAMVDEELSLNLDSSFGDVGYLPPIEKIGKGYSFSRDISVADGVLKSRRTLTIGSVEFTPEEYDNLREEIKAVEIAERKRTLLKKAYLSNSDYRILDWTTKGSILSDKSWVITNSVKKEILTYAGKQSSAELKFNYHPSCESFDIVFATVSNKNGTVHKLTEKEISVMDCAWASSAPRYRPSKILVANLPSVEIGSVIDVMTVRTVTNAPTAFWGRFQFDSYEPMDRREVKFDEIDKIILKPRRAIKESHQAPAWYWRDVKTISKNTLEKTLAVLKQATIVPTVDKVAEFTDVKSIRDWMAKNIRVVGPDLYDLPLSDQLTDPAVVLKERYASRLDYVRTLTALMRGAGYDSDIVFAANNGSLADEEINESKKNFNPKVFSHALCRVKVKTGGFLGFFANEKTYYFGTENEYTPIGTTAFNGATYIDPNDPGKIKEIKSCPCDKMSDLSESRSDICEIDIRENGDADITVKSYRKGAETGVFRKRFKEMLPEKRSRYHQSLLGTISQGASATSELIVDTEGYPASMQFSCYVPSFARVAGRTISVEIPEWDSFAPDIGVDARRTPVLFPSADELCETVIVRFPKGYRAIESVPDLCWSSFSSDFGVLQTFFEIEHDSEQIILKRMIPRQRARYVGTQDEYALIKSWAERERSRTSRTIIMRKE